MHDRQCNKPRAQNKVYTSVCHIVYCVPVIVKTNWNKP